MGLERLGNKVTRYGHGWDCDTCCWLWCASPLGRPPAKHKKGGVDIRPFLSYMGLFTNRNWHGNGPLVVH